jgi:hypothetical protein
VTRKTRWETRGEFTVTEVARSEVPSEAATAVAVSSTTGTVVTGNVAVYSVAGTVTVPGTDTTPGAALASVIVVPPAGEGPLSSTVPVSG